LRKAPPLAGALAKVAVGCLETVPVCLETNIANTLQNLQRIGWQVTGLAGETENNLADVLHAGTKQVIVMGAPMFCTQARSKSLSWAQKVPACETACAKPAINSRGYRCGAVRLRERQRA